MRCARNAIVRYGSTMPSNVDLFAMHQLGILEGFTNQQLQAEFMRSQEMVDSVMDYQELIIRVVLERSREWRESVHPPKPEGNG